MPQQKKTSWDEFGPSINGCRFYANAIRKFARLRTAPITAAQRRALTAAAEVFDDVKKQREECAGLDRPETQRV